MPFIFTFYFVFLLLLFAMAVSMRGCIAPQQKPFFAVLLFCFILYFVFLPLYAGLYYVIYILIAGSFCPYTIYYLPQTFFY